MSLSPETFEDELQTRLGREYRLRYSPSRRTWNVEQQVGRGNFEAPLSTDATVRLRDGYALVLESQRGAFYTCPHCFNRLKCPVMRTAEVHCHYCEARGRKHTRFFIGYYPLCEALLRQLESTSPKRGFAWAKEMKAANVAIRAAQQRQYDNETADVLTDYFPAIAGISQSGYGGSIKRYTD